MLNIRELLRPIGDALAPLIVYFKPAIVFIIYCDMFPIALALSIGVGCKILGIRFDGITFTLLLIGCCVSNLLHLRGKKLKAVRGDSSRIVVICAIIIGVAGIINLIR